MRAGGRRTSEGPPGRHMSAFATSRPADAPTWTPQTQDLLQVGHRNRIDLEVEDQRSVVAQAEVRDCLRGDPYLLQLVPEDPITEDVVVLAQMIALAEPGLHLSAELVETKGTKGRDSSRNG